MTLVNNQLQSTVKMRLKELFNRKVFKFLIGGGIAALINLLLIFYFIEWLGLNTPILRNVANSLSIELSLLASFFIYRIWVWPGEAWTVKEVLWRQIPLYHISAGTAVVTRIFLIFPLLESLEVNYTLNTLAGVLVSASLNYLISDRLVFQKSDSGKQIVNVFLFLLLKSASYRLALLLLLKDQTSFQAFCTQEDSTLSTESYHPEGLAPAVANACLEKSNSRGDYTKNHHLVDRKNYQELSSSTSLQEN
ncbi:MAG: GtrA family protein [Actinomycetota bacterium]